jgi:hypothetical protein
MDTEKARSKIDRLREFADNSCREAADLIEVCCLILESFDEDSGYYCLPNDERSFLRDSIDSLALLMERLGLEFPTNSQELKSQLQQARGFSDDLSALLETKEEEIMLLREQLEAILSVVAKQYREECHLRKQWARSEEALRKLRLALDRGVGDEESARDFLSRVRDLAQLQEYLRGEQP